MNRFGGIAASVACALACVAPAAASGSAFVGALHGHSGYSDGWPGSRPADYYASGRGFGLDFVGGSDHSDSLALPIVASEECIGSSLPECLLADPVNPPDSFRKWDATAEQAQAATDTGFTAFRGFEWTSDRFGHVNVYFSRNYANAKADGGYVSMGSFWSWLATRPELGGGGDGLAVFNHPDDKKLSDSDPGRNWNDFAYAPAVDRRMVGIEVFNDRDDYGEWYTRALDAGWHVGAIGAEDLGHRRDDDWGGPGWAKTVIDAPDRSAASLKAAMLARSFYAVRRPELGLRFTVDGEPMGSRLERTEGDELEIGAAIEGSGTATLELVTSGGRVVASGSGSLDVDRGAARDEPWYFVRASEAGEPVAYSSPVWVGAQPSGNDGRRWLAGELHAHTCYSHDSYCPLNDDNTGPDELYTARLTVQDRFTEAAARDLDYLAITDHNDVRSLADPGFGSSGVIGVPAYENSLRGHAQMLGAGRRYDNGEASQQDVNRLAGELRAKGGVFQINHPVNDEPGPFDGCGEELDWSYGLAVKPDVLEVWNAASASLPEATAYWERCWLQRGERIPATGGGDSHWAALAPVQGAGNPTTWALADRPTASGVLDAIRAGRTTISRLAPGEGGGRLLLEADADGDGTYESGIGSTVAAGTALRLRSEAGATGLARVRANGETVLDNAFLAPGATIDVPPVGQPGWVRAELRFAPAQVQEALRCDPIPVLIWSAVCQVPSAERPASGAGRAITPALPGRATDRRSASSTSESG